QSILRKGEKCWSGGQTILIHLLLIPI
ncbi:uncharacterized protein METZ01_LOCUS135247, partial [marine metagenome]